MIFGTVDIQHCEGCFLAHSLNTAQGRVAKGTLITASIALQLAESGLTQVLVAQLEPEDIHENDAALTVASQLQGTGVSLSKPRTGRVNLLASVEGLCHFNAQSIIKANAIDEGITIATIPENRWIAQGRMVATVKIIPYAVKRANISQVLKLLKEDSLSVSPAIAHKAELIQTRLSSIKESVLDKTRRVIESRLVPRAAYLVRESRCQHDSEELSIKIGESLARNPDWILIAGASAISDRADVIPEAIIAAGGSIVRYGIPVDPGNLLLLGQIKRTLVIGLPGCARSPRYNGLDMVIDRLACDVPVTGMWLNSLSVGGLLAEIADRPAPRMIPSDQRQIGAVILAAGSSRRAGDVNKLLVPFGEVCMVHHIAQLVCRSRACRVIVVTGHDKTRVMDALSSTSVECHHNVAHQSGMASSLVTGVSQLAETDGVLICLGDMPHVTTEVINQLIDAFKTHAHKSIFIPVLGNKRGNPILFGNVFFDSLLALEGDAGARYLVQQNPDAVFEVTVDNDGVLVDYDTREELAALDQRQP